MSKLPPAARRSALLAVSLAMAALAGCSQNTLLLNQPLAWAPTNSLALGVTESHGTPATVQFETFRDTAPNPSLVGENVENAAPRQVTTADPVGPFVTRHLQQLFAQAGYIPGGTSASRVISGEVSRFFVREGNTYNGTVVLKVTVTDRRGKVLWQGTAWGGEPNLRPVLPPR